VRISSFLPCLLLSLGSGCGTVVGGALPDGSVRMADAGHDAFQGMDVFVPPGPPGREATVVDTGATDASVACSSTNLCPGTQTLCVEGTCTACGEVGEPCCGGESCFSASSLCLSGQCVGCGGIGEDCCVLSTCTSPTSRCSNHQCEPCGQLGAPCCAGDRCYSANGTVTCIAGECASCGYPGNPCCDESTCFTGCCNTASQCTTVGCE
jgi:hypothetical protein